MSKLKKKPLRKKKTYWAHETAIVDDGARIGTETKIWHWSHICGQNVHIGKRCSFGQNVYVGNDVHIGNNVRVQNNVSIYNQVQLEDDVFCGPSMVFTNVVNPRSAIPRKEEYKKTIVKVGATLGANCTIICGHTIGEYAFVAAGAVVTKDVKPYALMAGVPARQIGWMCECGVTLKNLSSKQKTVTCTSCQAQYAIDQQHCERL
jgi:UDP-2-acetamido-3-amino-2,3-dideoxy-glucuronate N-acetyltransferase